MYSCTCERKGTYIKSHLHQHHPVVEETAVLKQDNQALYNTVKGCDSRVLLRIAGKLSKGYTSRQCQHKPKAALQC